MSASAGATAGPASADAPRRVLPVIVLAQLAGTSPWFAVNAVMPDLQREFGWPAADVGTLTSALQLGFIAGTLVFALLAIADRFSARRLFLLCSLASAACTVAGALAVPSFGALLGWRALTGFFLAGIYPVGMKIASMWFPRGLGSAMGWLIGALVLGSASAHALRAAGAQLPWPAVFYGVALLALAGGVLLFMAVPERPRAAAQPSTLQWRALASIWTDPKLRASVLGYFGHMWELYSMWVLVPVILATRIAAGPALSWAAFGVLGVGAIGCVAGGRAARRIGSARVATWQVGASGACCLLAPWLLGAPDVLFALWLVHLGCHRGRRLTAVLGADRVQRAAARGGQRAHAGQQHRLRDLDRQHPAVRVAGPQPRAGLGAAVAGHRAAAGGVGDAAVVARRGEVTAGRDR